MAHAFYRKKQHQKVMRYFAELSYKGTMYNGWQVQPGDPSVQEAIEKALQTLLRVAVSVTGCGRTDSGVHARYYVMHFDYAGAFPEAFLSRLNQVLPKDIAIHRIYPVSEASHARFDAWYRSYAYHLAIVKNPFDYETSYYYPLASRLDTGMMQEAAAFLMSYESFAPFCKTHSDAQTMKCKLYRSEWEFGEDKWVYHISANRFLRGMVRLIVGMCLNVGLGKIQISDVKEAMDEQIILKKSYSVPAQGLFLTEVKYGDII